MRIDEAGDQRAAPAVEPLGVGQLAEGLGALLGRADEGDPAVAAEHLGAVQRVTRPARRRAAASCPGGRHLGEVVDQEVGAWRESTFAARAATVVAIGDQPAVGPSPPAPLPRGEGDSLERLAAPLSCGRGGRGVRGRRRVISPRRDPQSAQPRVRPPQRPHPLVEPRLDLLPCERHRQPRHRLAFRRAPRSASPLSACSGKSRTWPNLSSARAQEVREGELPAEQVEVDEVAPAAAADDRAELHQAEVDGRGDEEPGAAAAPRTGSASGYG